MELFFVIMMPILLLFLAVGLKKPSRKSIIVKNKVGYIKYGKDDEV